VETENSYKIETELKLNHSQAKGFGLEGLLGVSKKIADDHVLGLNLKFGS